MLQPEEVTPISTMDEADVRSAVAELFWFHTIDLGDGIVTPGTPPNESLEQPGAFPDVRGKSVLDIGTWDGKYAFRAEQEGATRTVALDHYAWCVDFEARNDYWTACQARGQYPDPEYEERKFWRRDEMPGRRGFDLARRILQSSVEPVVGDFMTMDLDQLGTFDVVLYFGVLYHMREPFTALRRLRQVTRGMAVIETAAVRVPDREQEGFLLFFPGAELSNDHGNWYVPSERALLWMCRAAGFAHAEARVGPPPLVRRQQGKRARLRGQGFVPDDLQHYRAVVHAFA
jgi:tRNA (mo5U34)-methyltransferase